MKLTLDTFQKFQKEQATRLKGRKAITVCCGTSCRAKGGLDVAKAIQTKLKDVGLDENAVELTQTGCHGWCEMGPIVTVEPEGTFYQQVKVEDADAIVASYSKGNTEEKLLYRDPVTRKKVASYHAIPFYAGQTRWALRNVGQVDPGDINHSIARGSYVALTKALTSMTPEGVLNEVAEAKLRGRGGGGFDAGRKWRSAAKAPGTPKYIICNGDEGDPGAFMDRTIMEGDPHGVLEGMLLAGFAVGASQGYIYVRQEYPLAVMHLRQAVKDAQAMGLLGDNILGTEFSFDVRIARGGGAFVCGESSALMRSIEGKVGEPRAKYVHATDKGLNDKPTVLNNVETFVNVPLIIEKGSQWFANTGTDRSKGTKAFSVVGKVLHSGLIEVPMGTTLRELIFDIAGGVPGKDRQFKAVQTGGPSGGCLPEKMLDLPVDFDSLVYNGSMMGSGGLIVMDDRNCIVDVARYFVHFLVEESCGKCVPCREGLKHLLDVLERITAGKGKMSDLDTIERLCDVLENGSLCALGKSAANPVRSTLRYFREEYEEHINEHFCKAGICPALCTYEINDQCTGCTLCVKVCPTHCISGSRKEQHVIDQTKCIQCGSCFDACNFNAIDILGSKG